MEEFNQLLNKYKLPILLSLVGIVLIIGGIFSSGLVSHSSQKSFPKESLAKPSNTAEIKVDVSGAVNSPGVYSTAAGSRVEDVVKLAGGFSDKANSQYISKSLNLSQKLSDGSKVYIPFEGETAGVVSAGAGVVAGASTTGAQVGLNSGTEAQLDSLPSVGPVTAQKIISGRPYSSVEDLLTKKIISKSVYDKIKDSLTLD